ncbi:MAG: alpha/beta fold hydrolase [Flavobacteriaceae bacterium]|nr:alpha/beta fold hydrolase [Flavobacteriaceae bacterium]
MKLYHKAYIGQGQPLIIIHGLLGTADNWHHIAQRFGEHFKVYVPDMRNHGRSGHADEISYQSMVADLLELMADLDIEKANIIGHSMGGKVAMQLAQSHSKKIEKLVVVDIKPQSYPRGHDHIFKALFAIPIAEIVTRKEAEGILLQNGINDFGERQFLLKNLSRGDNGKFKWKPNLQGIWDNYEHIRSGVSGKPFMGDTLFVKGENSKYITGEMDLEQLFPNATLTSIPNAGHWVHAEQPELFFETVSAFLSHP